MMKLAIFFFLASTIMVGATHEYECKIVRKYPTSNVMDVCKDKVNIVEFQRLFLKSGIVYERRSVAKTLSDYVVTKAVMLGVGSNFVDCAREADATGYNTFLFQQGECLASNVSIPKFYTCSSVDRDKASYPVYTSASLRSPDTGLPVSVISNLTVTMEIELEKFKLTVFFEEGSPLPDMYTYRLQFDGRSEVVTGSETEILVEELSTCVDLIFTLTPYIMSDLEWGSSATYQLPTYGVPPPVVDPQGNIYSRGPLIATINITNFVLADPCKTIIGFDLVLYDSAKYYPEITLKYSKDDKQILLTCKEINSYQTMDLYARTIDGVETPASFYYAFPNYFENIKTETAFDYILGVCLLYNTSTPFNSFRSGCDSYGGKLIGRTQIYQGLEIFHFTSWLPVTYNYTADTWQWDDGVFLPNDDPLWFDEVPDPNSTRKPFFDFENKKIKVRDIAVPFHKKAIVCYFEDSQ